MSDPWKVDNPERYRWTLLPADPRRHPCALICMDCGGWVWNEEIHERFHALPTFPKPWDVVGKESGT